MKPLLPNIIDHDTGLKINFKFQIFLKLQAFKEDVSVEISLRAATEPITLNKCLEQFTKQEELGDDEKYYCSNCKSHQLASKKLQIWRLPAVLVSNETILAIHCKIKFTLHNSFCSLVTIHGVYVMYGNSYLQIVHFKRFHFLNGRWIKSHKIVDFPLKDFDPTHYLAAVPCNTIQRYKELAEMGKMSSVRVTKARSVWTKCNGTIDEFKESELQEGNENCTNFTDQIITELKKEDTVRDLSSSNTNKDFDAENQTIVPDHMPNEQPENSDKYNVNIPAKTPTPKNSSGIFSPKSNRRMRQESTSLYTHPIVDDDLQDFHQHRLLPGKNPLDVRYELRSMVVS